MARTPQDVTGAELAVLQLLWDKGPANRRQLTDALYPDGGAAHYTTVQKLLERLEAKGFVAEQPGAGLRTFAAAATRDQLISRRLFDVADSLCEGSLTPLLMNLVKARRLTAHELQTLRDLIDELKHQLKPKGNRR
jgi:BlaI family transcriptional regulator, penicillinase repressor